MDLDIFHKKWPLTLIFDLEIQSGNKCQGFQLYSDSLDIWYKNHVFDLTFFLWPWYLTLRPIYYYLDALKKTLQKCIVLTSRDAKTAPRMLERRPPYPISISSRNFATNQKSLRLPVPKLWLKRWFSWFLMCLTLTLTFQGHLIFVNSPFVPLHDWCKFWSDMFIISGDIAHWNMEKLPILYNGNFRCHGNVCYIFPINAIFCKLHRIGPSNMCVNFEKNRLNIDDFKSDFINQPYHIDNIQNSENFKWPWPLTFIWPWPWVWPLTLTIWRNTFFSKLFVFFWSHVT